MIYRIEVHDGDTPLGIFATYRALKFSKRLNNYGSCSFQVPTNDETVNSLVALRRYSVWIYRDSVLVWSGEQAIREGALTPTGNNWCTITCYDWFELLLSRYTPELVTYTGIDAGEIAWDLISVSQADSSFGITQGTIEATQLRDRIYETQNIGDAIINLANVINGFDFEVSYFKVFNALAMIGIDRSDLVFEYGQNISSIRITEDFANPINRAIVLGDSGDPDDPLRVERNDLESQSLYRVREGVSNESTVIEVSTLEEKGDAVLRQRANPLLKTTMTLVKSSSPTIANFALGDSITLKVESGVYHINRIFRIYEWTVAYNSDDTEQLTLVLGDFITL